MKARSPLATGARSSQCLALLCCLLLVLVQIGAATHALSHYRVTATAVAGTIGATPNLDQNLVAETDACALCLAFGVLSSAVLPALPALTAVAIAVAALAAIAPVPALAAPRGYRARAPPFLLVL